MQRSHTSKTLQGLSEGKWFSNFIDEALIVNVNPQRKTRSSLRNLRKEIIRVF